MKRQYWLSILVLIVLQGCATDRCDKVQPYQKAAPQDTLRVPADLSEPPLRTQSPDVDPNAPTRRADGRCLERPPVFEPVNNS